MVRCLTTQQEDFKQQFKQLLAWETAVNATLQQTVAELIDKVRKDGDQALIELSNKFDRLGASNPQDLEISVERLHQALAQLPIEQKQALEQAATRIKIYAEKQKIDSFQYTEENGTLLGQRVTPLDSVGIYVPGGKAAYPSSVLMNALPAKVAGVKDIIMTVPTPKGEVNELVLAAAALAGVNKVFTIGGAQAIAALAYGTNTVPKVDKIVGPGNSYVAEAKRQVFGIVGIDMIAGPSEILVLADAGINPEWIAVDLFSQAEHDEVAQSIFITPDKTVYQNVIDAIERLLPSFSRKEIIHQALNNRGACILTQNWEEAIDLANQVAPEHLELAVADPHALLPKIRHAGAIFSGYYTPEAFGDYCAGPNHVLPTNGTARFSSPLGVYDFQKRSSLIACSQQGAALLSPIAATLAYGEALTAHAKSAELRNEN